MLKIDTAQLAALAEVIRTGSFDRAASTLGVTPSAVSQRIRALEERQGAVLVNRSHPCTGTDAGMRLFRHAEEVALLEHALQRDLGGRDPAVRQTIRIAVNADSLATWFPAALATAQAADLGLLFELILDDQDHSSDWLRRGDVVAAVTGHAAPVQGCDSTALGALRYLATASPDFMTAHFPDGVTREALETAPTLTFDRKDALQARWIELKTGAEMRPPTHYLPASQTFVDAALLGLGWGMNPEPLARPLIAEQRLVALDPALPLDTPLFWQTSRVARAALAPLSAAVVRTAPGWLEPAPAEA